jgi:hypothetical protein
MRPFSKLPVAKPVTAPTVKPAAPADIKPKPAGPSKKPAAMGKSFLRKPASTRPVSGLMDKEPPCLNAKACKPATSPGVM